MTKHILFLAVMITLLPSLARAQATRTWVSGVGDDANPGSRTAPCKTFVGALAKTAAGGVVDVLDAGGFGAVTITKSITIEGDAAEGGILTASGNAIIINAGVNDVVILRNLTLEGFGSSLAGVEILSARSVHIENCRFNAFIADGINFLGSVSNATLFVKDCTIHRCSPSGINLAPSVPATVLIEKVNITDSGHGISANSNAVTVVTDTTVSGNSGTGFLVDTNGHMTITRGTAVDNAIGIQSAGIVNLSSSTVVNNAADGLKHLGAGKILTARNNVISGNTPDGKANGSLPAR